MGDMLYLVNAKKTITFDMKADWREIAKLKYGWKDEKSGELRAALPDKGYYKKGCNLTKT